MIEILSPTTAQYDLKEKKNIYERHGVKEYWIVAPDPLSVQGYALKNTAFEKIPTENCKTNSTLLDNIFSFEP